MFWIFGHNTLAHVFFFAYYIEWKYAYSNAALSPIRTVIVSQGDVSDFHHIQGVVGDLIAVRIQDVGVFSLTTPVKISGRITYCFLTNTEVVW